MTILITGGAGYIGSHTCIELITASYDIVVLDNLSNSQNTVLDRIKKITKAIIPFENVDLRDTEALEAVFKKYNISAVIHFAGLKSVNESINKPIEYYDNNIAGTINLCKVMHQFDVKKMIFSSSAVVYGNPETVPIKENFPLSTFNPYGQSKLMTEQILNDIFISDNDWQIALLRYFNPVGAHKSGLIGEAPGGIPSNLMPYLSQVAVGKLDKLHVFGGDYDTPDGTCIRDFIHVVDLAKGHVKALDYFKNKKKGEVLTLNLGTGKGYSVLELIHTFQDITGKKIPYDIVDRRPGDIVISYASPELAEKVLSWKAEESLEDMCRDTWRWQSQNPSGYE
ncbi:MAG: UDP-glucose 4-epimerase GalE [Gammaproteobacteria bacterium]|nr:UDP-glucose 4-epimerase GalE [Gammaproteobacteria bacterium]